MYPFPASPIHVPIGQTSCGKPVTADLSRLTPLLIGGVAGSGKTMLLHAILTSLIQQTTAKDARLLLIDCGGLDLTLYNGVPHLMQPVITSPKDAFAALQALKGEIERRLSQPLTNQPRIFVVIDELSPVKMLDSDAFDSLIFDLTIKGQQAGVHLLLTTLHCSSYVLSGRLRACIPSRIALRTATEEGSRLLLDDAGAQTLLKPGDMLYLPAREELPCFLHGYEISEGSILSLVAKTRAQQ